jgi:hypothetical protein
LNKVDSVLFADQYSLAEAFFYGQQSSRLAIITCGSTLEVNLTMGSNTQLTSRGVTVYYEAMETPVDFVCPGLTTTASTTYSTASSTTGSTAFTAGLSTGDRLLQRPFRSHPLLALPVIDAAVCDSRLIECPKDYVIVFLATDLASSRLPASSCVYR